MPPAGDKIGSAWYELAAGDDKLRADLARAEAELQRAGIAGERNFAQPIERGADRAGDAISAMARTVSGISNVNATELADALNRAQREAEEALAALRAMSAADLNEADARRYADGLNEIEAEAKVTASELRELQAAQPEFDTPELREATAGLDRLGKEANEVGNEFREIARANPDATLGKAARESKQLASGMDQAGRASGGLLTKLRSVQGALLGLGLAIGAQQILGFFNDAIEAASNLGETVSKASQIFGAEAIPALERWAETAATAFGQSKQQALDGAATFAIFGKSAGLAGADLVGFSTELVELSSDLASFANTSPEEAITAIGAALRGESEPIRRYGVLLDDATLRQAAFTLGITTSIKQALTPQQRVLAAQAEIFRQTADAQGDFARTSEGLANQQRIQAARIADAMTKLGEALLPVALGFTEFAADAIPAVIEALQGLMSVLLPLGGIFLEHANILIPALIAVMGVRLVQSFKAAQVQAATTGTSFRLMGLAAKAAWGAALLGIPLLLEGIEAADTGVRDMFLEMTRGKDAAEAIHALADELVDLGPLGDEIAAKMHDAGISVDEFREIMERTGADSETVAKALIDNNFDIGASIRALVGDTTNMSQEWAEAWRSNASTFSTAAGGILQSAGAIETGMEGALGGMDAAMSSRVASVMATMREVPGGVAATLEDGSTVVAGSADTLAAGIADAFERADEEAQDIAREIPGNIATSILEGRDAVVQASQNLADAATDPLVERARIGEIRAQMKEQSDAIVDARKEGDRAALAAAQAGHAQLEIELAGHLLRQNPKSKEAAQLLAKYFKSEDPATQAAVQALLDAVGVRQEQLALDAEQHAVDTAMALPEALIDARNIAAAEQANTNAVVAREAAALADPMFTSGFTAGQEFGSGVGDRRNQTSARNAADTLGNAALNELNGLNGYGAGEHLSLTFALGITAGSDDALQAAARLAAGVAGFLPRSEPKDPRSALRGITKVGGNIVRMIAGDMLANLDVAEQAGLAYSDAVMSGLRGVDPSSVANLFPVAPAAVQGVLAPAAAASLGMPSPVAPAPVVQEVHHHTHLEVDGFVPEPTTAEDVRRELRRLSLFTTGG